MTIAAHVRAALAIILPRMTAAAWKKIGHILIALGQSCLSIGNGDEAAMDDLYEGIEAAAEFVEDWPGPDRLVRRGVVSAAKNAATKVRDRTHG